MLVQSQNGYIDLLPALPKEWSKGSVKGICARGGFVIDMDWDNGAVTRVKIFSKKGGKCLVHVGEKEISFNTIPRKKYNVMEKL
jgi:alpha-L-fucosidase 2